MSDLYSICNQNQYILREDFTTAKEFIQRTVNHISNDIIEPYISQQNGNAFDAKFALIGDTYLII